MTHLKIEQNNGIIEEVSSAVIDKLYDIVHSGNLDNTSNLIGRLHTTATYQDYIDYLEDTFKVNNVKLLIIDATKKYIRFADPEVASYWANSTYGDGTGIDSTSAASVLNIPNEAFKNNTSILTFNELSRYFPNCTTINYYAFRGTSNLTSINLSNITTIGERAFDSSGLSGVLNLSKVNSLGQGCLALTKDITEINIGTDLDDSNRITVINMNVFNHSGQNDNLLQKVTGLNKVLEIKSDAFYNCRQLLNIDLTSELTTIRSEAFANCTSLECIDISNVTLIENFGLGYCSSLVDLATNDPTQKNTGAATYTFNWSTVPTSVFAGDPLNNKSFVFPNATLIKQSAFNSTKIVAISAPNVTSVETLAFREANQLVSVNLPSVSTIGGLCFELCTSLSTVVLGSVTDLGLYSAFKNCTSLTSININNVTTIPDSAFNGCTSLVTVNSNSAIVIKNSAFYNCTSLQNIDLDNVTQVGQNSLLYCTSLTTLNLPKFVKTDGGWSFCNNTGLLSVTFGDDLEKLATYAFTGCSNLTTVTFGINSSFVTEGNQVFANCTSLTTLNNFVGHCKKISPNIFYNCTSLGTNETMDITLSELDSYPEEAFGKTKYKKLIIHWPNAIANGWRANYPMWSYMLLLEYLDISDTVSGTDNNNGHRTLAFYTNTAINTVILPADYDYLYESVFKGGGNGVPNFRYLILLNPNKVEIGTSNETQYYLNSSSYAPNLHIYVLDSTLILSYLADPVWSTVTNLSTHIHPLSDLPAGVWTTGLASLYLTAALLVTS